MPQSGNESVLVKQIYALTDGMLEACQSGDWGLLERLEVERGHSIEALFETSLSDMQDISVVKLMIAAVLDADRTIMAMCSDEAKDCQVQLATFNQGKRAVAAYTGIGN